MQTPRFCGFCSIAGTLLLTFCGTRPWRTSWLIVGIKDFTLLAACAVGLEPHVRTGEGSAESRECAQNAGQARSAACHEPKTLHLAASGRVTLTDYQRPEGPRRTGNVQLKVSRRDRRPSGKWRPLGRVARQVKHYARPCRDQGGAGQSLCDG